MNTHLKLHKLITSTVVALAVMVPVALTATTAQAGFLINQAVAEESHESGHTEGGHSSGHEGSKQAKKGSGHSGTDQITRHGNKSIDELLSSDSEEDSDRPNWAGTPGKEGKPGGGSSGSDTQKGGDYGDIVVMLRNDDGTLVEDKEGSDILTYAVSADGQLITIVNGEIPEGSDVQEVEFGRLNIARSPTKVLDHSLIEVLSKLDDGILGDTVTLDPAGRLVTADGNTIDSPLENLALYVALLTATAVDGNITLTATASKDGADTTYTFVVPEDVRLDLAASAIAAASDKTGELTIDEIVGISSFVGVDDELASLVSSYDYSRTDTYDNTMVWILSPVEDAEGNVTYVPTEVDLLDVVDWNTVDAASIKDNSDYGIDVFTQSADDAVQALEFVHDNALDQ